MKRTSRRTEHDYWMSYSDLMAGLLLVFILLLIGTMVANAKSVEAQQQTLDREREAHEKSKRDLATLHEDVKELLSVRRRIKDRLRERFADSKKYPGVTFDEATGAVRLGTSVLFGKGSAQLTGRGQDQLRAVIPEYFEALLGEAGLREHVEQIVFEGHTSSEHRFREEARGYLFNLDLSQQRAYSAMEFVIVNEDSLRTRTYGASSYLAAIGYSNARTLCQESFESPTRPCTTAERTTQAKEAQEASRRLEIRFRLRDEEAMEKLDNMFQGLDKPETHL